jgi:cytochrome c oxidase cbb3-type subunit 4
MELQALSEYLRPWWVVWLLILFVGVVAWVYRSKNKKRYEEAARIPLKDENGG